MSSKKSLDFLLDISIKLMVDLSIVNVSYLNLQFQEDFPHD